MEPFGIIYPSVKEFCLIGSLTFLLPMSSMDIKGRHQSVRGQVVRKSKRTELIKTVVFSGNKFRRKQNEGSLLMTVENAQGEYPREK